MEPNVFSDKKNAVILILLFIIIVFAVDILSFKSKNTQNNISDNIEISHSKLPSLTNEVNTFRNTNIEKDSNESLSQGTYINNDQKNVLSTKSANNCIDPKSALSLLGKIVCIEYFVSNPYRSAKGNIFLNEKLKYKEGFTVWIPANAVKNFSEDPISKYGYKRIQVTGELKLYKGQLEIIANSEDQIKVLN